MPKAADAAIGEEQGRTTLRFERVLAHPPERVFSALTARPDLDAWHPMPFEIEPKAGGAVRYAEHGLEFADGEVVEYDPPSRLAYTWGEDLLRFELYPHEEGCLLVLTHLFDDRFKAARDAAGWHVCLAKLEASLASGARTAPAPDQGLPDGWSELNAEYQQRFGIPPEKATPPPPR
jgi:uncharacterized protein YndB with AHSA1/START domain